MKKKTRETERERETDREKKNNNMRSVTTVFLHRVYPIGMRLVVYVPF